MPAHPSPPTIPCPSLPPARADVWTSGRSPRCVALQGCARARALITTRVDGGGATAQEVLLRNEAGLSVRVCEGLLPEEELDLSMLPMPADTASANASWLADAIAHFALTPSPAFKILGEKKEEGRKGAGTGSLDEFVVKLVN